MSFEDGILEVRIYRDGDADDADDSRRRCGQAVHNTS